MMMIPTRVVNDESSDNEVFCIPSFGTDSSQSHFFSLAFEWLLIWCVEGQCQERGLFYKDEDVSKEYDQTEKEQV
jgi:hypothetical protein